jgi:hypothetical protein
MVDARGFHLDMDNLALYDFLVPGVVQAVCFAHAGHTVCVCIPASDPSRRTGSCLRDVRPDGICYEQFRKSISFENARQEFRK